MKAVGQVVCVKHKSIGKGGHTPTEKEKGQYETHGDARVQQVRKSGWSLETIKAIYLDGSVMTQSGDVWEVKPSGEKGAQWETVGEEK